MRVKIDLKVQTNGGPRSLYAKGRRKRRIEFRVRTKMLKSYMMKSEGEWSPFEYKGRPLAQSLDEARGIEKRRVKSLRRHSLFGCQPLFEFREVEA